ncbi:site-specific integrase [Cohnella herbarum]|uniref:Site-specific integrase n=1 Tax=Cohnella herbarum TaxID=2728023 RepID=A0A7Z2VR23_9BACL|nr:tyrosine-type recombinase/integrase [Cohnella herbarum]QJD87584.1 site-specific integrase [Cohnella herbarum]
MKTIAKSTVRKRSCKCEGKCKCGATWSYRLELGPDPKTGKRRQTEKHGFKSQKEAELAYAKAIVSVADGTYVSEKNVSFKEFAEQWIDIYAATGKVRNSTIDIRRARLKNLSAHFSEIPLKKITRKMYQDMLIELKNKEVGKKVKRKGYSKKTIESIHETAKLLFANAVDLEIIASDPTEKAQLPTFQKTVEELENENELPKYLEKEELARFLHEAKKGHPDDFVRYYLLAYTGLRIGEMVALKWRDIDLVNQTININKTLYEKDGVANPGLNPPKTISSKRVIDINKVLVTELKSLKARQNIFKMEHKKTYLDKDYVFAREDTLLGYPISRGSVHKRMTTLLKYAGLNTALSPHSMRHTHTSLMAEAGVSIEAIMERLGHKSDRVTKDIYLHVTKTRKKEAVQKLDELMNGL